VDSLWEILIAAALCGAALRMAYLGVHVTIHPPANRDDIGKEKIKKEFISLAVVSIVLVILQSYRASSAYSNLVNEIRKNQNASVGLLVMDPNANIEYLLPNRTLVFSSRYVVTGNSASNVRLYCELRFVKGPPSIEQDRATLGVFRSRAVEKNTRPGQDYTIGTGPWMTSELLLTEPIISDFMSSKGTIYLLGEVVWKNPNGSDSYEDACERLEPPKVPYLVAKDTVWGNCER
jgi:hypothetical protein